MPDIASICVYCGSSLGHDPRYRDSAERFGRLIGEACLELVYGGGNIGLMGVLADAALGAGARVTGIIPTDLKHAELAHEGLDELVVVATMHERKRAMFDRSDAFVALAGGIGTLEETLEMVTWRQLALHDKPVVIVNEGGYWRPLIDLVDHTIEAGFARQTVHGLFAVVERVEDVLPTIERMPVPRIPAHPERG